MKAFLFCIFSSHSPDNCSSSLFSFFLIWAKVLFSAYIYFNAYLCWLFPLWLGRYSREDGIGRHKFRRNKDNARRPCAYKIGERGNETLTNCISCFLNQKRRCPSIKRPTSRFILDKSAFQLSKNERDAKVVSGYLFCRFAFYVLKTSLFSIVLFIPFIPFFFLVLWHPSA